MSAMSLSGYDLNCLISIEALSPSSNSPCYRTAERNASGVGAAGCSEKNLSTERVEANGISFNQKEANPKSTTATRSSGRAKGVFRKSSHGTPTSCTKSVHGESWRDTGFLTARSEDNASSVAKY